MANITVYLLETFVDPGNPQKNKTKCRASGTVSQADPTLEFPNPVPRTTGGDFLSWGVATEGMATGDIGWIEEDGSGKAKRLHVGA